jgi:hypothetical protein
VIRPTRFLEFLGTKHISQVPNKFDNSQMIGTECKVRVQKLCHMLIFHGVGRKGEPGRLSLWNSGYFAPKFFESENKILIDFFNY